MRTIKFRGKSLKDGEFENGSLLTYQRSIDIEGDDHVFAAITYEGLEPIDVEPNTVGQFTGLFDKNGKEIYEGDILKVYYYGKSKVFGAVRFDDARFYIDDEFMRNELKVKVPMTELFSHYQFEVIGNIHDNPELLKGE